MKCYKIKGWERFQHYKGRNQVWIKLYKNILHSSDWASCSDAQKGHLIALLCIADEHGKINADTAIIRAQTGLNRAPNLAFFLEIGFIEELDTNPQSAASSLLAKCSPIREEKRREEKEETGVDTITRREENKRRARELIKRLESELPTGSLKA